MSLSNPSCGAVENPQKAKVFPSMPWYPGMRVIDAMILCQALNAGQFEFQIEYNSVYGAFVNKVDSVADSGVRSMYNYSLVQP
jgi:hypothetical protein